MESQARVCRLSKQRTAKDCAPLVTSSYCIEVECRTHAAAGNEGVVFAGRACSSVPSSVRDWSCCAAILGARRGVDEVVLCYARRSSRAQLGHHLVGVFRGNGAGGEI